jgi:hypothetical protein
VRVYNALYRHTEGPWAKYKIKTTESITDIRVSVGGIVVYRSGVLEQARGCMYESASVRVM